MGVLEQIRACLINEMIRVFVFHYEEANTIDCMRKTTLFSQGLGLALRALASKILVRLCSENPNVNCQIYQNHESTEHDLYFTS